MIRVDLEMKLPASLTPEALDRAPREIQADMRQTIAGSVLLLEGEIVRRTPVGVSGMLRGATATEIRGTGADITGRVFNPTIYGAAVDAGSRSHTPPLRNIELWAKRVIGGNRWQRAARAIWIGIRRKGTKAQPFWSASYKALERTVMDRHEAMLARIMRRLGGA